VITNASPYRPDIDGLRAVAIIPVIVFHLVPERLPGGYLGVDVFFVISGYLITALLLREAARVGVCLATLMHDGRRSPVGSRWRDVLACVGLAAIGASYVFVTQMSPWVAVPVAGAAFERASSSIRMYDLRPQPRPKSAAFRVIVSARWSLCTDMGTSFLDHLDRLGVVVLLVEQPPELAGVGDNSVVQYLCWKGVVPLHDLFARGDEAVVLDGRTSIYLDDDHLTTQGTWLTLPRLTAALAEALDGPRPASLPPSAAR